MVIENKREMCDKKITLFKIIKQKASKEYDYKIQYTVRPLVTYLSIPQNFE